LQSSELIAIACFFVKLLIEDSEEFFDTDLKPKNLASWRNPLLHSHAGK
jgi:hypothetical protein